MKNLYYIISLLFLLSFMSNVSAQIYSFEDGVLPSSFEVEKGKITISSNKYKLGEKALRWDWKADDKLTLKNPNNLANSSIERSGGLKFWIYNSKESDKDLILYFSNPANDVDVKYPVKLNFVGWRNVVASYREDMGHKGATIRNLTFIAPSAGAGQIYIDYLEFVKSSAWERMTSDQHKVNMTRPDIENFVKIRDAIPTSFSTAPSAKEKADIAKIMQRLDDWYLSDGGYGANKYFRWRNNNTNSYVNRGKTYFTNNLKDFLSVRSDGTVRGPGLYPTYEPSKIDGSTALQFRHINEGMLTQFAYDYRKNGAAETKTNLHNVFDWMNNQGWANGSSLGTLRFEKLRSSGYFNSIFLMRDDLGEERKERELATLGWYSLMGNAYMPIDETGENTDNMRTLALAKIMYALMQSDEKAQLGHMSKLKNYYTEICEVAHGYAGLFKPDNSGFHHRSAYYSAYFPEAMYTLSLVNYLLHDTEFALPENVFQQIKKSLLSFRSVTANYSSPASVSGRFPESQNILVEILPAMAYLINSKETPDSELTAALKRLWDPETKIIEDHTKYVTTQITFKTTLGETVAILDAIENGIEKEVLPQERFYQPFAGLMTIRNSNMHYSIRGFSKYCWDFESSGTENLYGRYLSNGHIQMTNLESKRSSFSPSHTDWDWSRLPGTTAKYLSSEDLKLPNTNLHRNFSPEAFLGGVSFNDFISLFSVKLADQIYDTSFKANKSVFSIDGTLLCLGSNIENDDSSNTTETTLFQNIVADGEKIRIDGAIVDGEKLGIANPEVLDNYSNYYHVIQGNVDIRKKGEIVSAVINHGKKPQKEKYVYSVIPSGQLSVVEDIEIRKQDEKAHHIFHKSFNMHAAAIFNSGEQDIDIVKAVNSPSIVMFKTTELGLDDIRVEFALSDPDMRQKTAKNMTDLTNADVAFAGLPFDYTVTLEGIFQLESSDTENIELVINEGNTLVTLRVKEGATYHFSLLGKKKDEGENPEPEPEPKPKPGAEWPDNQVITLRHFAKYQYKLKVNNGLPFSYELIDISGKLVVKKKGLVDEEIVDLTRIPPGMYVVRIKAANYERRVAKIIR